MQEPVVEVPSKRNKIKRILLRSLRYFAYTILGLILLPTVAIQFPLIQTWVVHLVSSSLSDKLQTRVEVGSVSIAFFNKIILNEVYVEDLDRQPMIEVSSLSAEITQLPLFGKALKVGNLILKDGGFYLRSNADGANIAALVAKLSKPKDPNDSTRTNFFLETKNLEIRNFKYNMHLYKAQTVADKPYGVIYQNMEVDSIYMTVNDLRIQDDTIHFRIPRLVLRERSGFVLQDMQIDSAYFANGKDLSLFEVRIQDNYSQLHLKYFSMTYDGAENFKDFINKVNMRTEVISSNISFLTIGYFAPLFKEINLNAQMTGLLYGTIANLKGENIQISTMSGTYVKGLFSLSGLPDFNSTIIYAKLEQLSSSPSDVFNVLSAITSQNYTGLARSLSPLHHIDFSGTFTGLLTDFVANGKLNSNLGRLKVDLLMNSDGYLTQFKGKLVAESLKLNEILQINTIGLASFNLMVDGKFRPNFRDITQKGTISSVIFNGYDYENIQLNGRLLNNQFSGQVGIDDPNINLDFLGELEFGTAQQTPTFDFTAAVRKLDLVKLNFNKRDTISNFVGHITAKFTANSILDFIGKLEVDQSTYTDNEGVIDLGKISLTSSVETHELSANNEGATNKLQLNSRFVDAQYVGQYDLGQLVNDLFHIVYIYFPILHPEAQLRNLKLTPSVNKYELHVQTKNSGDVMRILHPSLYIEKGSQLDILIQGSDQFDIQVSSPRLSFQKQEVRNLKYHINSENAAFNTKLTTSEALFGGVQFKHFSVLTRGENNLFQTHVQFHDTAQRSSNADIRFATRILESKNHLPSKISVDFQASSMRAYGDDWLIDPFKVNIDSSRVSISGMNIHREGQSIAANGHISKQENDTLLLDLFGYKLTGLNFFTQKAGYVFDGAVSGNAQITSLYDMPNINLDVLASDVSINNDTLGNVMIASNWIPEMKRLNIVSRIYSDKEINTSINGFYIPSSQKIQLDAQIKQVKLSYLNPILKGILSNINGKADGKLELRGTLKKPELTGKMTLNKVQMMVDYLQTPYKLDADIVIHPDKMTITDGTITDDYNQKGRLNVMLNHHYFQNITFDAFANINNLHCMNTKKFDNALFYGSAFATGGLRLSGNPKEFNFDITAQSNKNSIMYIPLPNSAESKSASFIRFKTRDTLVVDETTPIKINNKSVVSLGMDLTVGPESEIQILVDEKVGDIIKARGQGNLKIKVNPSINLFDIVGDFRIDKGDYNFTVPNFSLISRKFMITPGSQISFKGDILNAILDVKATYKERVSLSNIVPSDSTSSYKRTTVICEIQIQGKMTSPTLKFDLQFPDVEPEKRAVIQSLINTEEKLTRQFLALLVLKSFMPEQDAGSQAGVGSTMLLGNASEMLSSQIGDLINLFNLPVPVDINVEYTDNAGSSRGSEYDVDITVPISDRIILNGSAGSNRRSTRNFVGDFEAEVLAGKSGHVRFKAFTKSHDYFSDDMENNRQGVGVSYQGQFQKLRDLFRRVTKKKKKSDVIDPSK